MGFFEVRLERRVFGTQSGHALPENLIVTGDGFPVRLVCFLQVRDLRKKNTAKVVMSRSKNKINSLFLAAEPILRFVSPAEIP